MTCTIVSSGKEKSSEEFRFRKKIPDILKNLKSQGYHDFWMICEDGIPLWIAEELNSFRVSAGFIAELHIAVPYRKMLTKWNRKYHWDLLFYRCLPPYTTAPLSEIRLLPSSQVVISEHKRPGCYQKAEKYMLKQSNLLYVFGSPEDHLNAVRMAKSMGIEVQFAY